MRALTEEEFTEWKSHPMTRALMEILAAKRESLRQAWEGGSFTDYEAGTTALINVGNIGTCKGYAFVMDFDYETYTGELDDGKSVGAGAQRSGSADQTI